MRARKRAPWSLFPSADGRRRGGPEPEGAWTAWGGGPRLSVRPRSTLELRTHALEQGLGQADALSLADAIALVLDAEVSVVAGVEHDPQHPLVVGVRLVAGRVEVVGLG